MIARRFALLIVAALVGLVFGALVVSELRSPERTVVDPIELDSGDDEIDGGPKRHRAPDANQPAAPREEDPGADPAPAPPAPAGDDDGDDDSEPDDDDDGDD